MIHVTLLEDDIFTTVISAAPSKELCYNCTERDETQVKNNIITNLHVEEGKAWGPTCQHHNLLLEEGENLRDEQLSESESCAEMWKHVYSSEFDSSSDYPCQGFVCLCWWDCVLEVCSSCTVCECSCLPTFLSQRIYCQNMLNQKHGRKQSGTRSSTNRAFCPTRSQAEHLI